MCFIHASGKPVPAKMDEFPEKVQGGVTSDLKKSLQILCIMNGYFGHEFPGT